MLERGWKKRRAEADAKRADRESEWIDADRAAIREQRAQLAEQARRDAEATLAAAAAAKQLNRVSCPCCGGGADGLLVTHAEMILRAIAQMPDASRPDARVLAELHGIAAGTYDGAGLDLPSRGSLRLHRPRPVTTETVVEPVTETPAEPVKAAKSSRRQMVPPPFLSGAD